MKRKLIKQAGQAITITLPIDWIRENDLSPGEEINLEVNEKQLILNSNKKVLGKKISLDATNFPRRMKHIFINAAYAKGVDEINLIAKKENFPDLDQTLGFAVVNQKGNNFTIKDISGISSENLDEIFKRVFHLIINFYDRAIKDIFKGNKETKKTLRKIDGEINKFTLFLQREVMKHSYPDSSKGKIMFTYSFALEKISDEILRLWRTSIQDKIKKTKEIKEIILLSKEGLEKSFDIYYQNDSNKIKELMELKQKARTKSMKLLNTDLATSKFILHAIKIIEDSADLTHLSLIEKL